VKYASKAKMTVLAGIARVATIAKAKMTLRANYAGIAENAAIVGRAEVATKHARKMCQGAKTASVAKIAVNAIIARVVVIIQETIAATVRGVRIVARATEMAGKARASSNVSGSNIPIISKVIGQTNSAVPYPLN
jgi:hypothetical protein